MNITRLHLINIKGIKDLDLKMHLFPNKPTIFVYTALFCQHKKITGLRCKILCSPIPFQFIILEAFIHFIRYVVVQRLMKARRVVEAEVGADTFPQFLHVLVAFKVDVLVLEASPETLNPDVVQSPVLSVHAYFDVMVFKNL